MSVLKASLRSSVAHDVASRPFHRNIYDISLPEVFLRIRHRTVSYLQEKISAVEWLSWRHLSFWKWWNTTQGECQLRYNQAVPSAAYSKVCRLSSNNACLSNSSGVRASAEVNQFRVAAKNKDWEIVDFVALRILAHLTSFPDIFGSLFLSDVCFDNIILTAVRPTVNFCNPVVTLLNARFNFKNSTFCPHTLFMILCGSQNKQRWFHYTPLTDWFLYPRRSVFTARYGLELCVNQVNIHL
jgi:hypothetical protein